MPPATQPARRPEYEVANQLSKRNSLRNVETLFNGTLAGRDQETTGLQRYSLTIEVQEPILHKI